MPLFFVHPSIRVYLFLVTTTATVLQVWFRICLLLIFYYLVGERFESSQLDEILDISVKGKKASERRDDPAVISLLYR